MQPRSGQVCRLAVLALAVVLVLAGAALAQPSIPTNIGTWKLTGALPDVGADSLTSITLKYEAAGTGVKATLEMVGVNGVLAHLEFSGDYDGKDNPITGSSQAGDVVALTRLDANTVRLVHKRDGRVLVTETAVVSSDGKTMTVTTTGATPWGVPINGVAVWEKQ
ncbi:MAG TPA: hypothetical protein VLN08_17640 [Vicinamibacterales bacterium]|nr:hypothetical protein [Vicinamibacterales bacterium]